MPRTCPFCSLLCDDYFADPGAVAEGGFDCPRAAAGLDAVLAWEQNQERLSDSRQAEETAHRIARRLAAARRPLILVGGCDVGAARSLIELARRTGSVLASQWPARTSSGYTATLEEVRTRSDCVIVVGGLPQQMPLLVERFLRGGPTLRAPGTPRYVFHVDLTDTPARTSGSGITRVEVDDLLTFVITARGGVSRAPRDGKKPLADPAGQIRQQIEKAAHVALLWSIDIPSPLAAALEDWAGSVRRTRHCVTLPLDPEAGRSSFHNVCSWTSGFQPPIDFGVSPEEELCYAHIAQALQEETYDAVLAINPHAGAPLQLPGHLDEKAIFIDSPFDRVGIEDRGAVFLAPQGHYFRGDGVAMLRTGGIVSDAPTLQQMAQRMAAAVAAAPHVAHDQTDRACKC